MAAAQGAARALIDGPRGLGGVRERRRLPGFRFEFQPPPPADVLPRMDIAAFVGFAGSGPLHLPVPVEDPQRFAEIFFANSPDLSGLSRPDRSSAAGELPLAWDAERGEWAKGQLGPAVAAFLRNGGRRCWVVRVADADQAETSRFQLPGVLQARWEAGTLTFQPATAAARSPGSWADELRVGAGLTAQGVTLTAFADDAGQVTLQSGVPLAAGDVLRLLYAADGVAAYVSVEDVALIALDNGLPGAGAYFATGSAAWFAEIKPADLGLLSPPDLLSPADGGLSSPPEAAVRWWAAEPVTGTPLDLALNEDGSVSFRLLSSGGYPAAGSLVQLDAIGGELWLLVDAAEEADGGEVALRGRGLRRLTAAPVAGLPDRCERLRLELTAALGNQDPWRLRDLDFGPLSDRWWGALPSDAALYDPTPDDAGSVAPDAETRERRAPLWRAAAAPRFPLAGAASGSAAEGGGFSFPLIPLSGGLPPFGSRGAGAATALHSDRAAVVRDGLAELSAGLFLDRELAGNLTADLLNHANDLRYISPRARRLRGIHAVLAIGEVTLVAVPDATQRPWERGKTPTPPAPRRSAIPERAAWRAHGCPPLPGGGAAADDGCEPTQVQTPAPPPTPLSAPAWGEFLACSLRLLGAPQLSSGQAGGTIRLGWGPAAAGEAPAAVYTVEEATLPDFADARRIYEGPGRTLTLYGRSAGIYYYRARGQEHPADPASGTPQGNFSNWSNELVVRVGPPAGLVIKPMRRSQPNLPTAAELEQRGLLLQVQRGLLRMCAARGDLFAVLALPEHYREDDAIDYVELLKPSARPVFDSTGALLDLPLGFGETAALSCGAVYHPWLIETADGGAGGPAATGQPRRTPPDGAMTGLIAARSLSRGAWVAPANQELTAVVALTPPIAPARWLDLQDACINVIRQDARGFMTLSADTLSHDPDLVQINVRRLLQLLRRTAEQLGPGFVFEPQGDAFQRLVRRDVEGILRVLFDRGAFAGASPETSYQVTLRETQADLDAGRFIVEIRVAPSRPLEFLTVRLVQTGDRSVVTEEG